MKIHSSLVASGIVALSAAACAPRSAGTEPRDATHFIEHVGPRSSVREARLDGERLFGATMDVSAVEPGHYAGYAGRTRIDVRLDGGRIEGRVANLPTSLSIASDDGSLRLSGRYAGVGSDLTVTSTSIRGNLGLCVYDLAREEASRSYTGAVCGTPRSDLTLPESLDARPAEERAVMVALFLGHQNNTTQRL